MGNKVATFTEQQLDDYQVRATYIVKFALKYKLNLIGIIFLLFDTRIAPISQEKRFYGELQIHYSL